MLTSISDINDSKTLVTFISNYSETHEYAPFWLRQLIKIERALTLNDLRHYIEIENGLKTLDSLPELLEDDEISITNNNVSLYNRQSIKSSRFNFKSIICGKNAIPFEQRMANYFINQNGGVICSNFEELKAQEEVIYDSMKKAGSILLSGKGVFGISVTCKINEPRSLLQRLTDLWGAGPCYLKRAAEADDYVSRFLNVITFAIAGL